MINKTFFIFLCTFVMASGVRSADRVTLSDGKVLSGKIISEDDNEVSMVLGSGMYLHVEREKITDIVHDEKQKRPTVRTATTKPKPSPTPSLIKNLDSSKQIKDVLSNHITVRQTLLYVPQNVRAATFDQAKQKLDSANQDAVPFGQASADTSWQGTAKAEAGSFRWTSGVLQSSITVRYPFWEAPTTVDQASAAQWNAFKDQFEAHLKGHLDIYNDGFVALAETLSHLKAPTEAELRRKSNQVIAEARDRIEKRQQGFDRYAAMPKKEKGKSFTKN